MTGFDRVLMVDWSGGNRQGPTPRPDAIWTWAAEGTAVETPRYHRGRQDVEPMLRDEIARALAQGRRLLIGFDFPFGYPAGVARALTGQDDPFALWDWLAARLVDAPQAHNRFDVAAAINAAFPGVGPCWGNGLKRDIPGLPRKGRDRTAPVPERRLAETRATGAFPVWQMSGAGAVGGQVLMGLPVLARLRAASSGQVAVWPFEPITAPVVIAEVWPSLLVKGRPPAGWIKDAWQVTRLATVLAALPPARMQALLTEGVPDIARREEGWIVGLGQEAVLGP